VLLSSAIACTEAPSASTAPHVQSTAAVQARSPLVADAARASLHVVLGDAGGRLSETVASMGHRATLNAQLTALEVAIDAGDLPAATRRWRGRARRWRARRRSWARAAPSSERRSASRSMRPPT
jgi:hypothetical protein